MRGAEKGTLASLFVGLAVACSAPPTVSISRTSTRIGQDGSIDVTLPGTVLNRYAVLASDAGMGAGTLVLTSAGGLDAPAPLGPLGPGSLLLLIQMQGASTDTSDSAGYGTVTSLGGAGTYEFTVVGAVNGKVVSLAPGCGGLVASYRAEAHTQVVRVPQPSDLTVETGASVTAPSWNGASGGVVAMAVQNVTLVKGAIDVSGAGFRGGALHNITNPATQDTAIWTSGTLGDGGEKGEGVAGSQVDYDLLSGRLGRGAPANGGGGGNSHNAGGGGGANGDDGVAWTGEGNMDGGAIGASAWSLDPAYAAAGNQLTRSAGGGRGGYTYSANNVSPLTNGPGAAVWGGNDRRERGGHGGHSLSQDPTRRLFSGGGGGAGDENNGAGGPGGNGGGIVLLLAGSLSGNGIINASGVGGGDTIPAGNDGPGGGGGGGSIAVQAESIGAVVLNADGGRGGNQIIATNEAEGPGGGGGGGTVAVSGGYPTVSVAGGPGGTTDSVSLGQFPKNGATDGASGQSVATLITVPGCTDPDPFGVAGSGGGCRLVEPGPIASPLLTLLPAALIFYCRRRW